MLSDEDFQAAQRALKAKGQVALTKEERKQRQRALDTLGVPAFLDKVIIVHFISFEVSECHIEILRLAQQICPEDPLRFCN